ncbi:MAG: hypothetical protein KKG93_19430, partial [Bacteroidetes bacterium]|nr:hypothetical protein [Bacteroidota bacterium]
MKRNILLIEPGYKNKYPPIGLMKIATYHRMLGDNVVFFKGDLNQFVLNSIYEKLILKLYKIDEKVNWRNYRSIIIEYVKTGKINILNDLSALTEFNSLLNPWFNYYKDFYRKKEYLKFPEWDRICITTLFTFHWKITIDTIEFAKNLVKDQKEIFIGGVLATVLSKEVYETTGLFPHIGLLNQEGTLDKNKIIIDELPLDYSILDEIDYKYPESNAYYGYMTRGCIRKCSFCAVPKIEPEFNDYLSISDKIRHTKKQFGEQRNLLLLDNNILASNRFPEIIREIKKIGFAKGSKFIDPNYLDIAIRNLKEGYNDRAFVKSAINLIHQLLQKSKFSDKEFIYQILKEYNLLKPETASKANILTIYPQIKDLFYKYRNKASKNRYVDFNQGVDARLLNDERMQLLSEIPIRPLRIAFDSMKFKNTYIRAIELAAKYKIRNLSNYLLYNEKDHPKELYERLEINVNLSEQLNINIYSFPMKYHPIAGKEWFANRNYIGMNWNRKYIRAVQIILNATKGKVGRGQSFFYKAFGNNIDEYFKILLMPETYILYRFFFENRGYTEKWHNELNNFNKPDREIIENIVKTNE